MGSCTRRHFLLSICGLQLLTVIERQVFDFLGYMWAPILSNFFHIIFVIFGFFGAYQFRAKYILTYSIWNALWIGWNMFLICFYLSVGVLDKNSDILNLGTGSVSWFESNGYGCKPIYSTNITSEDPFRPVRPERVEGCILKYSTIEVIHASIQLILSVLGIFGAICIARIFYDEDDRLSRNNTLKSTAKHRKSLYAIEVDAIRDDLMNYDNGQNISGLINNGVGGGGDDDQQLSPKPMTPRRVKRRSVMTRGSTNRQSSSSRRSQHSSGGSGTNQHRNSSRSSSRRKFQQNPVTKLLEQQQQQILHQKPYQHLQQQKQQQLLPQQSIIKNSNSNYQQQLLNSNLTENNLKHLNKDMIFNCGGGGGGASGESNKNYLPSNYQPNISPDPIYYNMSTSTTLLPTQKYQNNNNNNNNIINNNNNNYNNNHNNNNNDNDSIWPPGDSTINSNTSFDGHFNPTYQHSTSNLHFNSNHSNRNDNSSNNFNYINNSNNNKLNSSNNKKNNPNELVEDLYNNRPPSVRSSYSNFHGTRPLSSYNPAPNGSPIENVFVGLTSSNNNNNNQYNQNQHNQYQHQHQQQHQQQQYQQYTSSSAAIPQGQVPPLQKRAASRESVRSLAFLNNGPPAYNLNYHTPPESETTM